MEAPERSLPAAGEDAGVTAPPAARQQVMTPGLTLLFAVAGGAAVGNLYWAQPLLNFIADDLHASTATAGWLVTASQIGYAAGILLIVPLGDVLDRRRLIPVMLLCAAAALVLCAVAPSMGVLLVAVSLLGMTTVAGQILTPLAGDLAEEARRGRVVGTVASSRTCGSSTSNYSDLSIGDGPPMSRSRGDPSGAVRVIR